MAVAILATTAALAPAFTPSVFVQKRKQIDKILEKNGKKVKYMIICKISFSQSFHIFDDFVQNQTCLEKEKKYIYTYT